ncbi:TRAP transporter substrate-binding protein DctP [Thermodesulfobacteriota bacterium]
MKKKKVLALFIGVFLIFSLSLLTTTSAKPIELKVSSWTPPQLPIAKITEKWARMVEERSGHTVKLTFYWAGTLASYPDSYRVVQTGVADIGNYVFGIVSGIHTLNEFTSLPMIGWDNLYTATRVYHKMRGKFPQLDAEFKGLKNIYTTAMAPNQFHFTKRTVRVPNDMRGSRIMAGGTWSDFLKSVNAVSVAKGPPDWYLSLQKGLVEGHFTHWPAVDGFKLEELFTSHTEAGDAGFGLAMYGWWMNMKTWNKLPKQAQQAFMDLQPWIEQEDLQLNARLIDQARASAKKMGHSILSLTPTEREIWTKAMVPIHEKWIAEQEAKGLPGKAVYNEAKRLIAQYSY